MGLDFPHSAKGLSAVCDCGISLSYSLTIFVQQKLLLTIWVIQLR